eukprot:Tbor_TRINITY_DN2476_c0_g1::TRINITY_DN2476_c0_g1_i1::g.2603::m.2603
MNSSKSLIPVSLSTLCDHLSKVFLANSSDRSEEVWEKFYKNIEVYVNIFYFSKLGEARDYWLPANKCPMDGHKLLNVIHLLMMASQHELLSTELYDASEISEFEMTVPTVTRWSNLIQEPFTEWVRGKKLYPDDPYFSRYMLVYIQGASVKTRSGLFLYDKMEILVKEVWNTACRRFNFLPKTAEEHRLERKKNEEQYKSCEDEKTGNVKGDAIDISNNGQKNNVILVNDSITDMTKCVTKSSLERYTLYQFLKDNGFWKALFKSATLSETFIDSVKVIYRPRGHGQRSLVEIREYTDVPLGDLIKVLPMQSVILPPFDTISFVVELVLLLSFMQYGLQDALNHDDDGDNGLFMTLLVLFGVFSRLMTLIFGYFSAVEQHEGRIHRWIDTKRNGKNESSLSKTVAAVCSQESKELLVGYFFVWRLGPITITRLKEEVEKFLSNELSLKNVVFDVYDSIDKLNTLGLIEQDGNNKNPKLIVKILPEEWVKNHPLEHLNSRSLRSM